MARGSTKQSFRILLTPASGIKFEKVRGDGKVYGLVPITWAPPGSGNAPFEKARKSLILAYMTPTAGDSVPAPFSVMGFTDLLKVPAATKPSQPHEGSILELSSFTTDVAKDHFTCLASGPTVGRSTLGSRMLQSLGQRKILKAQQDLKALCCLYCQYVWLSVALLSAARAYAQTV